MIVPYESLSEESRVMIFPGSRKFYATEINELNDKLKQFCEGFTNTEIAYQLKYDRFVVFIISDKTPLDLDQHNQLIGYIQELEKTFQLVLMDKVNVCFKQGEYVQMKEVPDFKKLIKNRGASKKTLVFDHMINSKLEYESVWELPAGESWLAHFF